MNNCKLTMKAMHLNKKNKKVVVSVAHLGFAISVVAGDLNEGHGAP